MYHPNVRIGIDARKLHDFGIGTYIRNLLRQLARLDQRDRVRRCSAGPRTGDGSASLGENFRAGRRDRRATTRSPSSSGSRWRCRREARHAVPRAALRAAAARAVPVGRDDPRLHPPDVPAVPAEPARARLRADVDRAGGAARDARADRVGELQARHPAVRRHRRRTRSTSSTTRTTSASASSRARRTSCACASATSCTTSSCCTPATSSRTRTSSG